MTDQLSKVRAVARQYRKANPQREGGVVRTPDAYTVGLDGHVFIAEGGDAYHGAKIRVAQAEPAASP